MGIIGVEEVFIEDVKGTRWTLMPKSVHSNHLQLNDASYVDWWKIMTILYEKSNH